MLIECDTCTVRGAGCGHCVIAEMLGAPEESARPEPIAWEPTERELSEWDLDAAERRALHVLAMAGLIAPASQTPAEETRAKPGMQTDAKGVVQTRAKGGFSRVERAS